MRGVFMEKIVHRFKNPILFIIAGIVVVAALAAGIYFLFFDKDDEPNRGTYVFVQPGRWDL
jgi:flagellar basal body-associated protein FliL